MPEALFSYHLNSEVGIINLLSVPHRKEKIEALRDEVSQLHDIEPIFKTKFSAFT